MSTSVSSEIAERVLAVPPGTAAAAHFFGYSLSDVSSFLMIVYAVLLIAWHLRTKWFAKPAVPASKGGEE